MPVSWPPVPAPRPKPAVDTDDSRDDVDPAVVVGHDGRSYRALTIGMCDVHLRNISRRIAAVKSKDAAKMYREDRDRLLDHRSFLMWCGDDAEPAVTSPIGLT